MRGAITEYIKMTTIYTYEVDHGDETPSFNFGTPINGGKIRSVCFAGQLTNNCDAHELLEDIFENEDLDGILYKKLKAIQRLI